MTPKYFPSPATAPFKAEEGQSSLPLPVPEDVPWWVTGLLVVVVVVAAPVGA